MRVAGHIGTVVALLLAFFAVPAWLGGVNVAALAAGGTDLVSSATVIQEAPSGTFTIFVNRDYHTDESVLALWRDFLAGRDVPLIMEDVSCVAVEGDAAGIDMANSLASRLPANQMKVRVENGVLALSKAEAGRFDMLVMSDEAAARFDAQALDRMSNGEGVRR